jgi:hypothetical protein
MAVTRAKTAGLPPERQRVAMQRIHDQHRTARMSCIYYEKRLKALQRQHLLLEIAIAVGTSSGVAGLAFWKGDIGRIIWGAIAAVAAITSAVKPLLGLPRRIEQMTQLRQGYQHTYFGFGKLARQVEENGELTAEDARRSEMLTDELEGVSKQDEIDPRMGLLKAAQEQVNRELPIERMWMPPIRGTEAPRQA